MTSVNEKIKGLYSTDKELRAKAMQSLVESGTTAVLPLMDLMNDENWIVRYRTVEALGLIGDERAVNSLTKMLNDEKDHVRYMAAKSLGFYKKPELSISLLPLLRDENEYVRRITAVSLGNIGISKSAAEALKKAAKTETDERAKTEMLNALSKTSIE
ncbi:HEAT repeat domain-containing protein [Methanochimaera problematica]|nr:HEAT repeat domain-containing protein [Methanoplanus sp. FWC-SCC4]